MLRTMLAAGAALVILSASAVAGGCVGDCYQQVHVPARYGTAIEREVVRAPRTYALYSPAEYRTVHERVAVRPAGRQWVVTRDAHGQKVGCWVETPAVHATLPRRVMVRAPVVIPYAQTTAYGYREGPVLVEQAHRAWAPIGRH